MSDQPLVQAGFGAPERQNRWKVAFRYILVIPLFFWLLILGIGAYVLVIIGWFAALFMGRLPSGIARYLSNFIIYATRVYSYLWLMNDAYPPFSAQAPFDVNLDIPVGRVRRLAVLFRIILLIPAQLVNSLVSLGLSLAGVFIWLIVLVKGSMPLPLFGAEAAVLRFQARTYAYAMMLNGKYPGELFGEKPSTPDSLPAPPVSFSGTVQTSWAPPPRFGPGSTVAEESSDDPDTSTVSDGEPGPEPTTPGPPSGAPMVFTSAESGSTSSEPPRTARLVLSQGAKRILVIFLILGVLGFAADSVVTVKLIRNGSSLTSLINAHNQLVTALTATEAKQRDCTLAQQACLKRYFNEVNLDFAFFANDIDQISFPSGAEADAVKLENATNKLDFFISQSTNGDSVVTSAELVQVQTLANTFDSDYVQLGDDLTGSI